MSKERVDAIVVGLGAVGGIVAEKLASAGLKVVGIEKGAKFEEHDFRLKHDEIRYYSRGAIVPSMASDPITWRATDRDTAVVLPWTAGPLGVDEPLFGLPSVGTGGGTNHWGAAAFRFPASEFRQRSAIVERFGEDALPEDTTIIDWPYDYDEIEPYYDMVEWEQGVSGVAGNVNGELRPDGNPFESPRSRDYPMPPITAAPGGIMFDEACRRLGYHPYPIPAEINSVPYNGRNACTNCGFCHGYPCHVGAKGSTQVTSLPVALATGNLEIRSHSRVVRVLHENGRVTGVVYLGPDGQAHELHAEIVVLSAFSLDNTRLLLLSDLNENGQVGLHFMTQNFGWANAVLPEDSNSFIGTLVAGSVIDDFGAERVPDNDEGVLWGCPIMSFPSDIQPLEAVHSMNPDVPRWGPELKSWLERNYRRLFRMYSQTTNFPSKRHRCDLDPTVRDPWGVPALRITHEWDDVDAASVEYFGRIKEQIAREMGATEYWVHSSKPFYHLSTHEVGIHRMGHDPASSVVDHAGESHECKGLWVLGGGQFPAYGGYNPTLTIQALAYRAADHLLQRAGLPALPRAVGA